MSNAEATRDAQLRTGDVDTIQREWDSFEGPRPMPDGRVARFWIRDLPLTLEEEVLTLMCEVYLREEQMAVATDTADDPQSFADLEGMWRDAIRHKRISLAAFTDWPHGDATRLTLVGVNVLGIVQRNDPPMTGPRPMPDGRVARFWIRDLPLTLEEETLTLMCEVFLRQEQMAMATGTADDPQSLADLEGMWRDVIRNQRLSLAAFTDWPHGDPTRLTLVGVNVLGIVHRNDPPKTMEGRWSRPMFAVMNEMVRSADVFARYGVRRYLLGMGLCVAPAFRGQRVGLRLLQARRPLCAALGVPLTVTAFSGAQSQKQARRAGFEVLETRVYKDFVDEDGSRPFTTTTWPVIELHALFYGPSDQQEKENPLSEH